MPHNSSGDSSSIPGRVPSQSVSPSPANYRDDVRPPLMSDLGVNHSPPARQDPRLVTQLGIFVDRMANHAELDAKHRNILHSFKEFVLDMPPTHWRATVSLQATVLQAVQAAQSLRDEVHAFKIEAHQATQRARAHFTLSSDQEAEIRALCKARVFEPHRTDYDIAENVRDTLKDADQYPMLAEAFKSKKGETAVLRYARSEGAYARNLFREVLRDSIYDPQERCSLTVCTRRLAKKLVNGAEISAETIINVAILRRFCREHPDLLDREELPPSNEDLDGDDSNQQSNHRGRRKRPRHGEAFWDVVSNFFAVHDKKWGRDIHSEGWSTYVDECIQQERMLFPDDPISSLPQLSTPPAAVQRLVAPGCAPAPTLAASTIRLVQTLIFTDAVAVLGDVKLSLLRPIGTPPS
ncbi:hypothetical protein OH76DRAFT_1490226 [Lentinus brumalis]|uniref:Uncharacterized protein n=1 Tax=Lentinus brumalis TaxID=2498619 RepID=A0A371CJN7_9APHY|nr:hypothetical protein OH76DRAFT_1490226 [Polyporus brumalis]